MADCTESSMKQSTSVDFRHVPSCDDCWTEEATSTLVDAWGVRYLELNHGNLRSKDWQDVANAVNARHGHTKKMRRTDVQFKNQIDTLKKKFKTENTKIAESNGTGTSSWPFFSRIDVLIGSNLNKQQVKVMLVATPMVSNETVLSLPSPPLAVPLSSYRKPSSSSIFTYIHIGGLTVA
ncbi:Trihelix transcription factor ASIL2 [Forsythia ovata]|uniref:Trihelix transcription factor ASIL2 n=1 Tax=Forsythia ovata TaxID=205694 RepID=A0ABD1U4Q9_9LAMI